jgi:hypothetical protein
MFYNTLQNYVLQLLTTCWRAPFCWVGRSTSTCVMLLEMLLICCNTFRIHAAAADHVLEGTVRLGGQEHFYLEPNGCIVLRDLHYMTEVVTDML